MLFPLKYLNNSKIVIIIYSESKMKKQHCIQFIILKELASRYNSNAEFYEALKLFILCAILIRDFNPLILFSCLLIPMEVTNNWCIFNPEIWSFWKLINTSSLAYTCHLPICIPTLIPTVWWALVRDQSIWSKDIRWIMSILLY